MSSANASEHSNVEPESVETLNIVDNDQLLIERSKIRGAVAKLTKTELQAELKSHNCKVSGNKEVLMERVIERRLAALSPISQEHQLDASSNPSNLLMFFNLMQTQQSTAEKRFQAQLIEQQAAAEQRFQLQLEEIRQRAKEDRLQLAQFLADSQLHAGRSASSDCGLSPDKVSQKFYRLDKDCRDLMVDLQQRLDNSKPVHEVEVILTAMQGSMEDCKAFVDAKVDCLEDEGTKDAILSHYEITKKQFYNQAAAAKTYIFNIKVAIEEDKQAGCLPSGISPPVFYGDKMKFPTFWDAFAPLVHENPKVSRFYKMTYLKAALKGDAAGALDSYPTTAENYNAAVEAVKKRFGRNQAIIRSHIKDLLSSSQIDLNIKQLRNLLDKVVAKRALLSNFNVNWDQVFVQVIEQQLPSSLQERWIRKLTPSIEADTPTASEEMIQFLTAELATLEAVKGNSPNSKVKAKLTSHKQVSSQRESNNYKRTTSAQALVTQSHSKSTDLCFMCSQFHGLSTCPEFLKLGPAQRLATLIAQPGKICFKCLQSRSSGSHPATFRKCTEKCDLPGCGKPHHKLLHVEEPDTPRQSTTAVAACQSICTNALLSNEATTILPTAKAKLCANGKTLEVRVAFDSFSQKSFICKRISKELNLKPIRSDYLKISGFGGSSVTDFMDLVQFQLKPLDQTSNTWITINAHVKDGEICSPLESVPFDLAKFDYLTGLHFADPIPRGESSVGILLGGQYYFDLMSGTVASPKIAGTSPYAIQTIFGWVLAGPCFMSSESNHQDSHCMLLTESSRAKHANHPGWSKLERLVQNFWSQEAVGLVDKHSAITQEDRYAVQQFNDSVSYDGDRYVVGLPFQKDGPQFCANYNEAFSRLMSTEKGLKKNPEKKEAYAAAMNEYLELGFAEEVAGSELLEVQQMQRKYFIPHHPVFKRSSCSAKVRIVFDASSKTSNGISLNDCLLKGPNLLPDITAVLMRFRMNTIALNGDLRKMFCQTALASQHQPYQLYLWRNCDTAIDPKIYKMKRLMFGVSSSPFLAVQCVLHHACTPDVVSKYGSSLYELLRNNMYMDDVHLGGNSIEEVVEKQKMLVDFFKTGGWSLVKFASNSPEVMQAIPVESRLPNLVLDLDNSEFGEASSLGLNWHTKEDVFYCKVSERLLKMDKTITKRSILSKVSQIFDVFGFLAAYTVRAKIILQRLWQKKVDWFEELTDDCAQKYSEWVKELSLLASIKIPRSPFRMRERVKNLQIHGFCDASLDAYAAVVYIRVVFWSNDVEVTYLMAKARVAPLKRLTIPRLELMAAHTLAKLANYVISCLKANIRIDRLCLWSDSKVALSWIAKPSSQWKIFIRNRVQEIHDLFPNPKSAWRHCPGIQNPADLHSRGIKLDQLKDSSLYWHGPDWLILEESCWPAQDVACVLTPESIEEIKVEEVKTKTALTALAAFPEVDILKRFSSYSKIVRVVARILRWRSRIDKTRKTYHSLLISAEEFEHAENYIFQIVQKQKFYSDYNELKSAGKPSRACRFLNMDPRFDSNRSLIVSGDRLQFSQLPACQKSPIILPAKDCLVEKLILHVHYRNSHSSQDTTIAILRERFYIVHIREEVRRVLRSCVVCRHFATKPLQQKMGVLPPERVVPALAFTDVGLDFTGPIYLKNDETDRMRKSYICIFTCTHSRMVHFELVDNMTTEEFLAALRRMMNRRGWCKKIISDNQLTFKKAEKIVQLSISEYLGKELNDETVQNYLAENGITWSYITERSPHRGAFYERLNRSLKEPMRKVLGRARVNYAEMYTILTDIEAALNQRPLTYLGSDPKNPQAVTPSHLAIGRPLQTIPFSSSDPKVTVSGRYKYLQTLLKHFWKRWSNEYLPTLAKRHKWHSACDALKVGDVCLISEDNVSRPNWPLGRIIAAIPSKDGLIRTYKLKTNTAVLSRPAQRLHLLEKSADDRDDVDDERGEISTANPQSQTRRGGQDVVKHVRPVRSRRGRCLKLPLRFRD